MKLAKITETSCPTCGAEICAEEFAIDHSGRVSQHVNGGRWETRAFACGHKLSYVPNFDKVEVIGLCAQDPRRVERDRLRRMATESLLEIIDESDVDEEWKACLRGRIE